MRLILFLLVFAGAIYFALTGYRNLEAGKAIEKKETSVSVVPAEQILETEETASSEAITRLEQLEKQLEQARDQDERARRDAIPVLPSAESDETNVFLAIHKFENRQAPPREELSTMLSTSLYIDEHSNTVAVKTKSASELLDVATFLKLLDVPADREQYQVEAVLVSARISEGNDFSIDWLLSFSYPVLPTDSGAASLSPGNVTATGDWFDISISKARTSGRLAILSRPRLILAPGEDATISSGREVPLPVSNVQDGNVQTTVEFRPVALQLTVGLKEIGNGGVRLDVSQINEQVNGFTQVAGTEVPELASQRWETAIRPEFGRWYAIGGVVTGEKSEIEGKGWLLRNLRQRTRETNQVGMFVRVVPVIPNDPPQFVEDVKAGGEPVFVAKPIIRAIPVGK